MANIFISRELNQCIWLKDELSMLHHSLTCQSCIQTQPVNFNLVSNYDWIFFSSSQGVQHFFSQNKNHPRAKLAAMGEGTAKALSPFGTPSFIGKSTTPAKVAEEFNHYLKKEDVVLFPVGKKSLKSIPQILSSVKKEIITVYDTIEIKNIIPEHHIYIFSSPSNFNSFIKNNSIPATSKIISFGPSTSASIQLLGLKVNVEISEASPKNILNAIISILESSMNSM